MANLLEFPFQRELIGHFEMKASEEPQPRIEFAERLLERAYLSCSVP